MDRAFDEDISMTVEPKKKNATTKKRAPRKAPAKKKTEIKSEPEDEKILPAQKRNNNFLSENDIPENFRERYRRYLNHYLNREELNYEEALKKTIQQLKHQGYTD